MTVDVRSLFLSDGLLCLVMDYDQYSADEKVS